MEEEKGLSYCRWGKRTKMQKTQVYICENILRGDLPKKEITIKGNNVYVGILPQVLTNVFCSAYIICTADFFSQLVKEVIMYHMMHFYAHWESGGDHVLTLNST